MNKKVYVLGAASGIAASQSGCGQGPEVIKNSPFMNDLKNEEVDLIWNAILKPNNSKELSVQDQILELNTALAEHTASLVRQEKFFTVFGGDHSCAIGTWSGVVSETHKKGDIGLVWIDAHMDSHTPGTSATGNIHGMPLACLLGYGEPALTTILSGAPKLKPEHVCLVGVRSYEPGEAQLLERLGVRIYFIDEVKRRGLDAIMTEAYQHITKGTVGFGVTLDIDSIDPLEAPATGVSEAGGLSATELCDSLTKFANQPNFLGMEIVEFDPLLDKNQLTEKLIPRLMSALLVGKS